MGWSPVDTAIGAPVVLATTAEVAIKSGSKVGITPGANAVSGTVALEAGTEVALAAGTEVELATGTEVTLKTSDVGIVGTPPVQVTNKPTTVLLHGAAVDCLVRSTSVTPAAATWTISLPTGGYPPLFSFRSLCLIVGASTGKVPYCVQLKARSTLLPTPSHFSRVVPFVKDPTGHYVAWFPAEPFYSETTLELVVYWTGATKGGYSLYAFTEAPEMLWRPDGRSYPMASRFTELTLTATTVAKTVLPALAGLRYLIASVFVKTASSGTKRLIVPTDSSATAQFPLPGTFTGQVPLAIPPAGLLTAVDSAVQWVGTSGQKIAITYDVVV